MQSKRTYTIRQWNHSRCKKNELSLLDPWYVAEGFYLNQRIFEYNFNR